MMEKFAWFREKKTVLTFLVVVLFSAVVLFFSPKYFHVVYDYTFKIAEAFTHGQLGVSSRPYWLSEMVPFQGTLFSVFPLGSVLTMLPFAVLKNFNLITSPSMPFLLAIIGACVGAFSFLISSFYQVSLPRRVMLSLFPIFGTWAWANLAFPGAWQLALGFAMVGELGALYFTICKRNPFWAGAFFALAFGNRTEIIITAPIFIYLFWYLSKTHDGKEFLKEIVFFCLVPFLLGCTTLGYNFLRFGSVFDFGYARIPGVLTEPWYRHGIFSFYAIPGNVEGMLLRGFKYVSEFPYFIPTGFGGSIILSSPFLFLLFRDGAKEKMIKASAWIAILVLTFILWLHGNPGGWQISYRYAMILIPWMLIIFLENGPKKLSCSEIFLFTLSVAMSFYTFYLFIWTNLVTP